MICVANTIVIVLKWIYHKKFEKKSLLSLKSYGTESNKQMRKSSYKHRKYLDDILDVYKLLYKSNSIYDELSHFILRLAFLQR